MQAKKGKLLIFSAPSGSGKTTLVRYLLSEISSLAFSVSATSRAKRTGEVHGKDYYFLSPADFKAKIEANAFLEWEEVYDGVFYGTLFDEVERLLNEGKHVIFDVDVVGGVNIKKHYDERALAIFIKAPSIEVLAERLRNRSTDSEESILKRIEKAAWEATFEQQFDLVVVNDVLNDAKAKLLSAVKSFLEQ